MTNNLSAAGRRFLPALLLMVLFVTGSNAQLEFTRTEVSRMNVLRRAALFENEILRAAKAHGVDPNILWTIGFLETRFRPWLRSPKNAQGMMQFIPSTAARFSLQNPYDPAASIHAAARYVKFLSNSFGGRLDSILAAYNSGEGTVSAYLTGKSLQNGRKIINPSRRKTIGGIPPYAETVAYVGRGLKIYRWLIMSGTFPETGVRVNFPTVISASIARVTIFDRELGKVADFRTAVSLPQTFQNKTAMVSAAVNETTAQHENQKTQTANFTEVYYDSRAGSRYLLNNGKREKLADSGIVVINNSRSETTNQARSTFFGPPSHK